MTMLFERKDIVKKMDKNIFIFFSSEDFLKRDIIFWIKKFT